MSHSISLRYRWLGGVCALAIIYGAINYRQAGEPKENFQTAPRTAPIASGLSSAAGPGAASATKFGDAENPAPATSSQEARSSAAGPYGGIGLPDVGSEGFGSLVQRALHGDDPKLALQAFMAIRLCKFSKGDVERAYERVHTSPDKGTQGALTYDIKREQRCQTVSPEQYGAEGVLAEKALLGGVPGAGSAMFVAHGVNIKAPLRPAVRNSLESEGLDGSAAAFMMLSADGVLNIDAVDRYAYQIVWRTLQSLTSMEVPAEDKLFEILNTMQDSNSSEAAKQSAGSQFMDVLFRATKPNLNDAEQSSAKTKARTLLTEIANRQNQKFSKPNDARQGAE